MAVRKQRLRSIPGEETMSRAEFTEEVLKRAVRDAVGEALQEHRDLIRGVVEEALEDLGISAAIQAGEKTEPVSRQEVFHVFEEPA